MGMSFGIIKFGVTEIRMVGTPDRPEWVAADVCEVLGIDLPANVLRRFGLSEKGVCTLDISGQSREMLTVTEPGLYRLIFKSRKPQAEEFRHWVTHEVLPSIRQFGCYPPPDASNESRAIVTLDANRFCTDLGVTLSGAISRAIGAVKQDVEELRTEVQYGFADLTNRIDGIERRKPLTEKTKRRHKSFTNNVLGGKCPCCFEVLIINSALVELSPLQYDHWFSKAQADIERTWPVCQPCNSSLRDPKFKLIKESQFRAYQDLRRSFEAKIDGPFLPGMGDL